MNNVKTIGITGGVGSGKSVVMDILKDDYQAAIILADLVAHDLMQPGGISYTEIVDTFGRGILKSDQTISRPKLAEIVFADADKLELLNKITHPNVKKEIITRIEAIKKEGKHPLIALEAALLLEEGYQEILDEVWYVYVEKEIRMQRLTKGRGYTREKSQSIMDRQLSEEYFRSACDDVIDNSGNLEDTKKSIKEVMQHFIHRSEKENV